MPRRRSLLVLASLLALALAQLPFGARASGLVFGPRVFVGSGLGEPSLARGPDGGLYISSLGPNFRDTVWKSSDGGLTWASTSTLTNYPFGGNDDHVVVAPDNTVYVAGQWIVQSLCHSVAAGPAGAAGAWVTQPIACVPGVKSVDRPWLAVSEREAPLGHTLYLYFTDPCCAGFNRHVVMRSDDRGLSWVAAGEPTRNGNFPGYIVVDDEAGALYTVTTRGSSAVIVSVSTDRAETWTEHLVAPLNGGDFGLNHIFLTGDDAGNLYTAWADDADGTGMHIWLSRSTDRARTWSAPLKLTAGPGTRIYPTLDFGGGRLVVAWYETATIGNPNSLPGAEWRPVAAATSNAMAPSPTWDRAVVSPEINHRGSICTRGAICTSARNLLDFFMVVVDEQGRANVTWADDRDGRAVYFARSL